MANYKVTSIELTNIANAIRAKGGTSAQLEFPDEFVSAIEDISSSGGGGGGAQNILYGAEEPSSSEGDNGDIFLQTISSMNAVLPSGYQELLAIEGTGTQYIDTTISTAQAGLSVKAKIAITGVRSTSASSGDGIWGGSWAANGYLMIRFGGSPGYFRWHYGNKKSNDVPVTLNKWISLETNDTGMIIDGVTYPCAGGGSNAQGTLSLFYVGSHSIGSPGMMRLGRTKVSVENTILADFVPCKNSDNEVGMYDLIGQTFYGNAGSGSFLAVTENTITASFLKVNGAWQDLFGSNIDDVDTGGGSGDDWSSLKSYIQSSGTQYIDTGYFPNDNTNVEVIASVSRGSNSFPTIFGMRPQGYSSYGTHDLLIHFYSQNERATLFQRNVGVCTANYTKYVDKKAKYVLGKKGYSVETNSYGLKEYIELTGSISSEYSLYIFNFNNMGSSYGSGAACIMKLYRFRIYEGDTIIHEFIPWQENGVACLKDIITGNIKYNAGTDDFVYGTDT